MSPDFVPERPNAPSIFETFSPWANRPAGIKMTDRITRQLGPYLISCLLFKAAIQFTVSKILNSHFCAPWWGTARKSRLRSGEKNDVRAPGAVGRLARAR